MLAGSGLVLALHKQSWARAHTRHLLGGAAVLVFIAGVLGRWHPSTVVGSVDLAEVSAGGDSGAALAAGVAGTLVWLAMIPLAYALLWPRTALAGLRASPGATWAALRWAWGLGIHRAVGRGLRALAQLLLGMNRRGTADDEAFEPIVARTQHLGDPPVETILRDEPFVDRAAAEGKLDAAIEAIAGPASPNLAAAVSAAHAPIEEEEETPATQIRMDMETPASQWRASASGWQLPPLTILREPIATKGGSVDNELRGQLIVDTLASFGVDSSVVQINEGPAVTQFGVEPGWDIKTKLVAERDASGKPILDAKGAPKTKQVEVSRTRIRVNRITALQNDLALALAAPALRIEAPVPGKPMVGSRSAEPHDLDGVDARSHGDCVLQAGREEGGTPAGPRSGRVGRPGGGGPRDDAPPVDRGRDRLRQVGLPQLDHHRADHELLAHGVAVGHDRPQTGRARLVRRDSAPRVLPRSWSTWTAWSGRCRR